MSTTITAIDREGATHILPWDEDQSLMEVLRDNDLPVLASCGGTASCATCHVFLDEPVFNALGERGADEIEILADVEAFRECGSRLSCQVEHRAQLDGITVTLAPEE